MKQEINCSKCGRYLGTSVGTTIIEGLICSSSKCKHRNNIKIVTIDSTDEQVRYKFDSPESLSKSTNHHN